MRNERKFLVPLTRVIRSTEQLSETDAKKARKYTGDNGWKAAVPRCVTDPEALPLFSQEMQWVAL